MIVPSYQGILVPGGGGLPIDMGMGCWNGPATSGAGYTLISLENPANDSGTIDTVELWYSTAATEQKSGTAHGSGSTYTVRDYASIGAVSAGSKQTFSGLSIAVVSGDFLAAYATTGLIERDSCATGNYYKLGDYFDAGETSGYSYLDDSTQCNYATGST